MVHKYKERPFTQVEVDVSLSSKGALRVKGITLEMGLAQEAVKVCSGG